MNNQIGYINEENNNDYSVNQEEIVETAIKYEVNENI